MKWFDLQPIHTTDIFKVFPAWPLMEEHFSQQLSEQSQTSSAHSGPIAHEFPSEKASSFALQHVNLHISRYECVITLILANFSIHFCFLIIKSRGKLLFGSYFQTSLTLYIYLHHKKNKFILVR